MAQELWAEQGFDGLVFKQEWPKFDEELARDEGVEIVLQVNGKVRGRMTVPHGTDCEELESLARLEPNVAALLAGKAVVKVICVAERLVNFVVR
jgi:leucyl-tRNA synthetase